MLATRLHRLTFALTLAAALAVIFVLPALAQAEPPAPDAGVNALVAQLAIMGGFAALLAALVNIGKRAGWVKDGQAPAIVTGGNLLGLVVLFILGIVKPDFDLGAADQVFGQVAQIATLILGLIGQVLVSKGTHAALRGVPVVGKSFSAPKA